MPLASQERVGGVSRFGRNRSRRRQGAIGRNRSAEGRNRSQSVAIRRRKRRENSTSFFGFGVSARRFGRNRSQSVRPMVTIGRADGRVEDSSQDTKKARFPASGDRAARCLYALRLLFVGQFLSQISVQALEALYKVRRVDSAS